MLTIFHQILKIGKKQFFYLKYFIKGLSIVLLASGIGACSNCTWKNLNERRYSKLKQRNEVQEKVCLHEISAPLVKEVVDGRNKSNLMINTSSSFTYSC